MSVLPLADGPAMYLGGSIMTFALPYGAFITAAAALYLLFRARHSHPRLKYLSTDPVASVATREPGPAPAPPVAAVLLEGPETAVTPGVLLPDGAVPSAPPQTVAALVAEPETAAPETAAPETAAPETAAPETAASRTAAPETAAPETAVPPETPGGQG